MERSVPEIFDDDQEYCSDGRCVECGADAIATCICGAALCGEHLELQGGFCSNVSDDRHRRAIENQEP